MLADASRSMPLLEPTELRDRAIRRLESDMLGWLSSVRPNGTPHTHWAWFWWNGAGLLLFARPEQERVDNIRTNSSVAFHLESNGDGRDVIVFEGSAEILTEAPDQDSFSAYLGKYQRWLDRLDWTVEYFQGLYSVPYWVTLERLAGF